MYIRIVSKNGNENFFKVETKLSTTQVSNRISKDMQAFKKEYERLVVADYLAYDWKEEQFKVVDKIVTISEIL